MSKGVSGAYGSPPHPSPLWMPTFVGMTMLPPKVMRVRHTSDTGERNEREVCR